MASTANRSVPIAVTIQSPSDFKNPVVVIKNGAAGAILDASGTHHGTGKGVKVKATLRQANGRTLNGRVQVVALGGSLRWGVRFRWPLLPAWNLWKDRWVVLTVHVTDSSGRIGGRTHTVRLPKQPTKPTA